MVWWCGPSREYNGAMRTYRMKVGDWLVCRGKNVGRNVLLVLEKRTDGYVRMSDGFFHWPATMRKASYADMSAERRRKEREFRESYRQEVLDGVGGFGNGMAEVAEERIVRCRRAGLVPLLAAQRIAALPGRGRRRKERA